jgi:ABC-2 type transport system permease protein
MSTLAVAGKDFRDSVRSRALVALVVLFGIFAVGGTYLFAAVVPSDATGNVGPALNLLFSLSAPIAIFVPLIGIVTGYKAIVGERTSGTVKLLLSLPHTRRDVVLGKVVGRIGVLAVAIIIGFVAAGVVAFVFYDTFPATEYVLFTLATVLLGAVYLVFAVSLSASTGSRSVALWGALGFFVVFQFLWGILINLLVFVANGLTYPSDFSVLGGYFPRASAPDWYRLLLQLSPSSAYNTAIGTFLPDPASVAPQTNTAAQAGSMPYFLEGWFGFVILAIWLVVPLVLGYLKFKKSDL